MTNLSTNDKVSLRERKEYALRCVFNDRAFNRVVVDPHYLERHSNSVDDHLILNLVKALSGQRHQPISRQEDSEFFKIEPVRWQGKCYRLIVTICDGEAFIGVINAFRVEDE